MEKRAAAAAVVAQTVVVKGMMGGKIEAGEEGFERGIAIYERGEVVSTGVDVRAEYENEKREEEEKEEVGKDDGCGVFEERNGGVVVDRRWWRLPRVVVHGGFTREIWEI